MPPRTNLHSEWTQQRLLDWGARIGPHTQLIVDCWRFGSVAGLRYRVKPGRPEEADDAAGMLAAIFHFRPTLIEQLELAIHVNPYPKCARQCAASCDA